MSGTFLEMTEVYGMEDRRRTVYVNLTNVIRITSAPVGCYILSVGDTHSIRVDESPEAIMASLP